MFDSGLGKVTFRRRDHNGQFDVNLGLARHIRQQGGVEGYARELPGWAN